MYKLTSTQHATGDDEVSNGGVVTKSGGRLAVKDGNAAQFQFFTYTEENLATGTITYVSGDYEATSEIDYIIGSNFSLGDLPAFSTVESVTIGDVTYTDVDNLGYTVSGDFSAKIRLSLNLPFTVGKYYFLNVRPGAVPHCAYYDTDASEPRAESDAVRPFSKNYMWSFEHVDGTLDQYRIYNVGQGKYLNNGSLGSTGNAYILKDATISAPNNVSKLSSGAVGFEFVLASNTGSVLGSHGGTTSKYGSANDRIAYWTNGSQLDDAGSISGWRS